jgi:hypothetical protein
MTKQIINFINKLLPETKLEPADSFYWSPKQNKIIYNKAHIDSSIGTWSMLHEAAHASLQHTSYNSDLGLLKLEVEAWNEAKILANELGIHIDESHIQDCLDTYRDWLHRRSTCPSCGIICIQTSPIEYSCHNCHTSWNVTASRFCRPYRLQISSNKNEKPQVLTATFR